MPSRTMSPVDHHHVGVRLSGQRVDEAKPRDAGADDEVVRLDLTHAVTLRCHAQNMKRLLICCDGTWNRPDSAHITNVEKIARTVQTDPRAAGGVHQLVYYISGVGGAGYRTDRILGGAFGFGLFHNVLSGYRFLAQNYEPGDEIFIVGFSRGAYTARSLGGMVARAGLLTKAAL